jgi:hypothetical protein
MPDVALYTVADSGEGGFVARVVIPAMEPFPDVIAWQNRFFDHAGRGEYEEAMVWFATELSPNQDP